MIERGIKIMDIIKAAEELLKKNQVCQVASVTEKGYPRIIIMIPLKTEGIKTFYFSTAASSKKIEHFKKNPKAGVTFYDQHDSVTLTGEMSIVTDKALKDSLWCDWIAKHFQNGGKDDPEYTVVKFVTHEGDIYVNEQFERVSF